MLRVIAIVALVVGGGMMLGGALDEAAPVGFVEDAAACEHPQKGCGSCWVEGDITAGELPRIECHN